MSLHLGNLSSRVRIVDLQRVFQRFGRCNVRVKDRFGFVVYDFPVNAERALKSLQGKKICGESISISWSNRQPRALQRTARGGSSNGSHHLRNSTRENHVDRKLQSDNHQDSKMGSKQLDSDGRRFKSTDLPEEATINHQDNAKGCLTENDRIIEENVADEGGGPKSMILVNDRWEEQTGNLSYENGTENGVEFDRYEPYHMDGDDRRDKDEISDEIDRGGSPVVEGSQKRTGIEESGKATLKLPKNMNDKQACYICGEVGHKMRNCPQEKDANIKKSRFDLRRDNEVNHSGKGEYMLKKVGSKSQGRRRLDRDAVKEREHKSERHVSRSRQLRQLIKRGHSTVERIGKKRQRRLDNGSPERGHEKKSRSSLLTPVPSGYAASKSKTKRSASRSTSHSRLRSRSLSSLSSSSTSPRMKPAMNKSGSRSKSRSRSSSAPRVSLSPSLHHSLVSSPYKEQTNCRKSREKASSSESKEIFLGRRHPVETDGGSGNLMLETVMVSMENGSATPYEVDKYAEKNQFQKTNDDSLVMFRDSAEGTGFAAELKGTDLSGGNLSLNSERETTDPQNCDACLTEHMPVIAKNLESEAVLRSHNVKSTSITPEEMHMALKHYGLEHPEDNEKDLPIETYFGSARSWPWEIIYYRRLRKGPISTENYARRIAQNKEFGIVDRYVRSSSGWGEQEDVVFEEFIN